MNIILMGPPGAGKGTQAEKLEKKLSISHISTGDMFRNAIKNKTDLGNKAKQYLDSGALVPDEITIGIVNERLQEDDCKKGFMLDGFPRTVIQAESLEKIMLNLGEEFDAVLYINVPKEKLIERLTGRRVCKGCGSTYHVSFNPPKEENKCDVCGDELYQRSDDTVETVENRLNVYLQSTQPLIDFYKEKGKLIEINGEQNAGDVFKDIKNVLGREY